jgi:pimeloyl-ACP methyl ester carboxylesterase
MSVESFEMKISDSVLDDLRERLSRTLPPDDDDDVTWDAGTSPEFLRRLATYWRDEFDWRAQEAQSNRLRQFKATAGGLEIHFIHERGRGKNPLPLVLTHGYPDSFLRFSKLIPLLVDPAAHGGDAADSFDVVVPSLPGYGFSQKPDDPSTIFHVGDLWHELMTKELGYSRFGAHGGDWGSIVTEHLARSHSGAVAGIHLTDVPFWHTFQKPKDASDEERKFFAEVSEFQQTEGAYAMIQGTRPLTLAQGLTDSPLGLAAWIVEKFQAWSDCEGDVEKRFTLDELLANITLYWVTETIGSSFLPYYAAVHAGPMRWIVEKAKELVGSSKVPAAFAVFPKDIGRAPREWAERFYNVQRWTDMPRGGHFAAMEEPALLADDIRAFFRPLRG